MDKYESLIELKRLQSRYYYLFEVPHFDLSPIGIKKPLAVRTSPSHSMPGILTSHFHCESDDEVWAASDMILADWNGSLATYMKKMLYPKDELELRIIYQEMVTDASYGVLYSRTPLGIPTPNYTLSSEHSKVVSTGKGTEKLSAPLEKILFRISDLLENIYDSAIDLEFAVKNDTIYLLQFRLLPDVPMLNPGDFSSKGTCLFKGDVRVAGVTTGVIGETILVRNDIFPGEEHLLDGVNAVLIHDSPSHCHLLGLCAKMGIPCLVGIPQEVCDYNKETLFIDAFNGEICQIKK